MLTFMWTCRSSWLYAHAGWGGGGWDVNVHVNLQMMMMTLMKLVNSATKFRHGIDKFYQPNSGLRSSRTWDEAIYTYICYPPPRTYVSEAATLLEGILPCCNDLSKEDGRCCWFINNFRFINSQDEIRDVALNYLIRLSLVRSFVIKNPYILDSIDITPNQNFVEYCKFNKIDHKKVMAKAKEQFLDKGLLEIFQYIFF